MDVFAVGVCVFSLFWGQCIPVNAGETKYFVLLRSHSQKTVARGVVLVRDPKCEL
jgi:hypothetical protein